MADKLDCENISDEIIKVTLHDPASGNALSLEAARELKRIIMQIRLKKSKIKVLIFTGHGRFFCTGGNLKFYRSLKTKSEGLRANREILLVLKDLARLPLAKIAIVNGDCFGGGLELLSCFDFSFTVPEALFGFWQSKQALSFGWGGGARIAERISLHFAKNALLGSQTFSSYEAHKNGLVNQVFSRSEIENGTLKFAQEIAQNSSEAISGLHGLTSKTEQTLFAKLWWSKDHQKRLLKK